MSINHQIVTVSSQFVYDSTKNSIKNCPRAIAAYGHETLSVFNISDAH